MTRNRLRNKNYESNKLITSQSILEYTCSSSQSQRKGRRIITHKIKDTSQ